MEISSLIELGIGPSIEDSKNNCIIVNCDVKCQGIDADKMMNYFNRFYSEPSFDCSDITLVVENCSFESNTLPNQWLLNNEVTLERLELIQCNIEFIQTGAFDSIIFEDTKELTINQLRIVYLRYDAFAGLNSLQTLNIIKMPFTKSEPKILEPMAGTLTKLVLQEIGNDSSSNPFIPNDFTGSTPLSNLKSLTMKYNNIKSLNFSSFSGVKFLSELNLANSRIEQLNVNTFDFASNTLRTIQLQNNLLKTLPDGIFDNLKLGIEKIKINLKNNLWHCDCDLIYLQNKILEYPAVFQDVATCSSPEEHQGAEIKNVELCPNTDEPTETTPSNISSTNPECLPPPNPSTAETTTTTVRTTSTTQVNRNTSRVSLTTSAGIVSSDSTTTEETTVASPTTTTAPLPPPNTTSTVPATTPMATTSASPPAPVSTIDPPSTPPPTVPPPFKSTFDIQCLRENGRILLRPNSSSLEKTPVPLPLLPRYIPNESIDVSIPRPNVFFDIHDVNENEVIVHFGEVFYTNDIVLIYYPDIFNASDMSINQGQVNDVLRCKLIYNFDLKIMNLQPSLIYTFCALEWATMISTPFHCKSHQTATPFGRQPWIVQEHKVIILTSFLVLILVALLIGVSMTYLLIRRVPTLMRGSKRVVMVNNRTKDVMVLPCDSRNGSCHKDPPVPAFTEASNYMTPLPRHCANERPPFVRSPSDTSLSARSYVTVNPPRFSQVFEPSDFRRELPRRCGSYPCQSPPPLPPHPNHRRSIVSTTSTAEIGKGFQSRNNQNHSVYKRQPSRISQEDETENHYNFII
ncbi:unnamed protein product [Diamesa hyperborea]